MTTAPRLPIGTQVVLRAALADDSGTTVRRGATAKVVGHTSADEYLIRLADGRSLSAPRDVLTLRKALQQQPIQAAAEIDAERLVTEHTIYAAVVGSRAFGLAVESSDIDLRGVYAAPTAMYWSLVKPPRHVEGPQHEQFSWEVERFCELALKANPNLLEVLHSPQVLTMTPLGEELVELRDAFLSQLAYQTYSGYVLSQFKKLEADLRRQGSPKWKHVMHLLRLLLTARTLLAEGVFQIDVGEHRQRLLAVRRGELAWEQVESWRLALHAELDQVLDRSPLPALPDVGRVERWLYSVRARSAEQTLRDRRRS